jgi:DNA-binding LacI/PurR family transcriptional regulator
MATAVRRPTIRDVAARAGVSKSLVSLVYSSPSEVSEQRKERVLEAAAELGFSPNFLARSLAKSKGTFVAILVADLHNPLFAAIVDNVRAKLEERGEYGFMTSAMITDASGNQVVDDRTVSAIIDLRPKSVLVVGSIPTVQGLDALPKNINIVVAGAAAENLGRAITVRSDDVKGTAMIVDHLASLGHKKIAFINVAPSEVGKLRGKGYQAAMKKLGLEQSINIVNQLHDGEKESYLSAKKLLASKNPPTAIICYNDLVAIAAQVAVNEQIADGGTKVAITGYDNTYLAALKQISLTSVDHGTFEIADKAAELLIEGISKVKKVDATHLLEPQLVIRDSSDFKLKGVK